MNEHLPDRSRLSLNQITVKQWSLSQAIEGCARHGIGYISIWRDKLTEQPIPQTVRQLRDAGIGAVLAREVLSLHRALDSADVSVDGVLGPGALARVLRDSSTAMGDGTDAGTGPAHPTGANPVDDAGPVHWPWPMAVEATWDAVRTAATWHATYWIAAWPRVDVTPDFLGALFFSPIRRSAPAA